MRPQVCAADIPPHTTPTITAWNTIETVIDKGKQIMGVIMNALGSIREIAAGNVAGAATFIENTVGKALPVVFSFAANFLGLGNIGTRIRNLVKGMRQKLGIDKVINGIIARLKKIVGAGKTLVTNGVQQGTDAANKLISTLKGIITPKEQFQVGKEKHSVWVEMKGSQPVIMVASTPADAMTHLVELRQKCIKLGVHDKPGVKTGLAAAATTINAEKRRINKAIGQPGKDQHLGTGAENAKKQANSVVRSVRNTLVAVYTALDEAQSKNTVITIAGKPISDSELSQLIFQAVHTSKAYIKLLQNAATYTTNLKGQLPSAGTKKQPMSTVKVILGPKDSFEGLHQAARNIAQKFSLQVEVIVHHQPTSQLASTPNIEIVTVDAKKIFEKRIAVFVTKGGSYSVRNAGGHHKDTDLMYPTIKTICTSSGLSERELSQYLTDFSKTRKLPPELKPFAKQIAQLMSVISGAESSRGSSNVASQMMTLELIGRGQLSFKDAFEGRQRTQFGGGAYPFSMQGGESGARSFEARLSSLLKPPQNEQAAAGEGKISSQAREFEARMSRLSRQWLTSSRKTIFTSNNEFTAWLTQRIDMGAS